MQITITNLSKVFDDGTRALNGVNLVIDNGLFGLLGPNGSGKTTLLRILGTLLKPSEGTVSVNGMDVHKNRAKIRAIIGYLPQRFSMFTRMSTGEFLDYSARLAGIRKTGVRIDAVDSMLRSLGLYEARDIRANELSVSMKRHLGIAQALIGNPAILITDEPTAGLAPEERLRFLNLLTERSNGENITIISTHLVGDITSSCTDMALLDRGEIIYHDHPEKLVERAKKHTWLIKAANDELMSIREKYPVISIVKVQEGWEVQVVTEKLEGFLGKRTAPNL